MSFQEFGEFRVLGFWDILEVLLGGLAVFV
jgi:hypothetical protein